MTRAIVAQRSILPLLMVLALAGAIWTPRTAAGASSDLYAGLLPDARDGVLNKVQTHLSLYVISAQLNPDNGTISGKERIRYRNNTHHTLNQVALRLYPNASYYKEGALTISEAKVEGEHADVDLKVDDTAILVDLPAPLKPLQRVNLEFNFTSTIPADSTGTYGVYSWATKSGTYVLADWYPIIAGYEAGSGWNLDPPTSSGDPTFSDAALYDVSFTAPQTMTIVATGSEVSKQPYYNYFTHRFITGPAREFSLVIDNDYVKIYTFVGKTQINAYANPGDEAGARQALGTAARALESYASIFGQYPYRELDLVDVPLVGALGVSWTGLVYLSGPQLFHNFGKPHGGMDPDHFDFVVAHEVGHQWWGSIIGSNTNDHAFQVEGLDNYLVTTFLAMVYGPNYANEQLKAQIADPYMSSLESHGDGVAHTPTNGDEAGPTPELLYGKSALGFLAIREKIGDEAFFAALHNYAKQYAYGISTPRDLLAAFEAASGQSLAALWKFWFESATTTPHDVRVLLRNAPETVPVPPVKVLLFG
ncbi:MAG: M1 family metallopeptidase [Thermomicrobiales bacterium]